MNEIFVPEESTLLISPAQDGGGPAELHFVANKHKFLVPVKENRAVDQPSLHSCRHEGESIAPKSQRATGLQDQHPCSKQIAVTVLGNAASE